MACRQKGPGPMAHLHPGNADLGDNPFTMNVVDRRYDGDVGTDGAEERSQAVERYGSDHKGIGTGGKAVADQRDLPGKKRVPPGFDQTESSTKPLGFHGHAEIHAEPVRILQMWVGDAETPPSRCPVQRPIGRRTRSILEIERRFPDAHVDGLPRPQSKGEKAREDHDAEYAPGGSDAATEHPSSRQPPADSRNAVIRCLPCADKRCSITV